MLNYAREHEIIQKSVLRKNFYNTLPKTSNLKAKNKI